MRALPFSLAATLAVALALIPYPGRWKLLQQILPVLVVLYFYRSAAYSRVRAGFGAPPGGWMRCLLQAVAIALLIYGFKALLLRPLLLALLGEDKDLSLFAAMEGNLPVLLLYLVFMWLLAALGEEVLWRGFLLREAGERLRGRLAWPLAIAISASFFALAHAYQGVYGVAEKWVGASILGGVYVWSGRRSIWLVVLIHGIGNTIGFVRIYLGL